MLEVAICGPNLNDQSKGTFHVHTADCADLRNYGPRGRIGGEEPWTVDAASKLDVVAAIYGDNLGDYGETVDSPQGRKMLTDWMDDLHFAPCVKFTAAPKPERVKRPPLKRASYRAGVEWIALNDDPEVLDPDDVAGLISTTLLADLFGQDPAQVAADVIQYRERTA